jgi:nucleotide-binding universal stress UspA family protein
MAQLQAPFQHILVPTDGSQLSVVASQLAVQLAALHRARVTFVYVVDTAAAEKLASASGQTVQRVTHELESTGQRYLKHLSRLAIDANLAIDALICHGTPYKEIERLARERAADLIVIGQVGQRGPRRILIGSVTERVIEYAPCPVLVVK